jgi:predicted PurR-regulated permease PerM
MRMMGVLYVGLLALCVLVTGFRMPSIDAAAANIKIDLSTKFETAMKELSSMMDMANKDHKSDIKELSSKVETLIQDLSTKTEAAINDLKSDNKELSTKVESNVTFVRTELETLSATLFTLTFFATFIYVMFSYIDNITFSRGPRGSFS